MKEQLKQELSDAIYDVAMQKKWYEMECDSEVAECCAYLMESIGDLVDKQFVKMSIAKSAECATIKE